MASEHDLESRSEGSGGGVAFLALTAVTAALLAFVALAAALPALSRESGAPRSVRGAPSLRATGASTPSFRAQRTVVYVVGSQTHGDELNQALTEWRLEVEALGTADQEPRRVVVVQTPEDVFHKRVIDFSILAMQAPGLDLQVIDLR